MFLLKYYYPVVAKFGALPSGLGDVMHKRIHIILFSLGILSAPAAMAQGDEESLMRAFGDENFISIATGARQPISLAPAVASVITAADIRAMGATDLDDVLRTVPGLHVSYAPRGYLPIYTIRGIYSENNPQVLVLVNDVPITNLYVGNRGELWGGMPVNNISRIEIIRGPGSAIYGADAFAGVINIITKIGEDIEGTETGARLGTFDTQEAWLLHNQRWRDFDISFSLEVMRTDGHDEIVESDAQSILDSLFLTDASYAPGPVSLRRESVDARADISRGSWRLRLGYQGRYDLGAGAGVALALDPAGSGKSERFNADLTHSTALSQNWDLTSTLSFFNTVSKPDLVLYPPGSFGGTFPDGVHARPYVYERHTRFNLSAFYHGFERHSLRLGAGAIYGDMYRIRETKNYIQDPSNPNSPPSPIDLTDVSNDLTRVFIRPADRQVFYAFVQDEWAIAPSWRLTSGIRYDHYSDFGDTVNPRLALVWQTNPNLTSKLLYGRAFRAPAFNELYNINNPVALGNKHLKPETIDTYELAFNFRNTQKLQTGLNLLWFRMDDVIRFTEPNFRAENTGEIRGSGLELEARYDVSRSLTILANYAYQDSEDEDSGDNIANSPRHMLYARINWRPIPDWVVNGQVYRVADRGRERGDPRSPVDDYTVTDLTVRYMPAHRPWEIAASVRNLFNEHAYEPSPRLFNGIPMIENDLPLARRSFYIEGIYRFENGWM
jgi:outer membrane cobalamin receptor